MRILRSGTARRPARRRILTIGIAAATAVAVAGAAGGVGSASTPPDGTEAASSPSTPPAGTVATGASTAGTTGGAASTPAGEPLLVYGVFATALEEPWDGAIHTALQSVRRQRRDPVQVRRRLAPPTRWRAGCATSSTASTPISSSATPSPPRTRCAAWRPTTRTPRSRSAPGSPSRTPNFSVFDNWLQDPAYLAGMLAGGLTKSGTSSAWWRRCRSPRSTASSTRSSTGSPRPTPTPPSRCRSSTPSSTRRPPARRPRRRCRRAPTCCSPNGPA